MNQLQIKNLDLNLLETFRVLVEEGSVNLASERLGRTPSAVSHALGRLRAQMDDPLLVRVAGRMEPSPRGAALYQDIRPVLAQIERAVQPPAHFVPETATRAFRISSPATALITLMTAALATQAPGIHIEWTPPQQTTFEQILNEEVDLALGIANTPLPDSLGSRAFAPQDRYVFARDGHPAIANWGATAWQAWPHVVVRIPAATRGTVDEAFATQGLHRTIGTRVPHWSAIGPILRRTNMLANQMCAAFDADDDLSGLTILAPPRPLPPLCTRLVWSRRIENDPAIAWLRQTAFACVAAHFEQAAKVVETRGVVPVRAG